MLGFTPEGLVDPTENTVFAERFRLIRPLGQGGMGAVWLAQHITLDVECALKLILAEAAAVDEVRGRFEREARAAARLRSPHIVQVLDHGEREGVPYIAMELLVGEDLATRLERKLRLTPEETVEIVARVARGADAGARRRSHPPRSRAGQPVPGARRRSRDRHSVSSSIGGDGDSGGDMTTGGGGGDPGNGTPISGSVLVPQGASDFARASSTSSRLGIVAAGGAFSGQLHLASFEVTCANAASCGLVTRFDLSGHPKPKPPWGIAVDSKGNIFVVGSYSGSLSINGASSLPTFPDAAQHAFVAKLNDMAAPHWANVSANAAPSVIASVAVDPDDNVIFAGDFTGAITLSTCPELTANGGTGSFVTRLDGAMGSCLWSEAIVAKSVAGDEGSGQWFVVGTLDGKVDSGIGPPLTTANGGLLVRLGN